MDMLACPIGRLPATADAHSVHASTGSGAASLKPANASTIYVMTVTVGSVVTNNTSEASDVMKDRRLDLVMGLVTAAPAADSSALDGCSVLLGSLMDGWTLDDGQTVHLPLFGFVRDSMHGGGSEGVALRLSLPALAGQTTCGSPRRFTVRAGVTRFCAAPREPAFPQSPLEWEAACLQPSVHAGVPSSVSGREDTVRTVVALAWGHMAAPAVLQVHPSTTHAQQKEEDLEQNAGVSKQLQPAASVGILLTGSPGSGKTTIALAVAHAMGRPVYRITSSSLYAGQTGGTEQRITALVAAAVQAAPCTILVEDAHIIFPARPASSLASRAMLLLMRAMDECYEHGVPILWLACTQEGNPLHRDVMGPSRLAHVVELAPLLPEQRQRALQPLLLDWLSCTIRDDSTRGQKNYTADVQKVVAVLAEWAASRTHGFSPADLSALIAEASRETDAADERPAAGAVDIAAWARTRVSHALACVRPSIALHAIGSPPRAIQLDKLLPMPTVMSPGGALSGAESDALAILRAAVLTPLANPGLYAALGSAPPTGVLLHGPSGSGKTTLAHAIAHEARMSGLAQALVVSGPDIISALVGSSEAALAAAFQRARELSPCILVLDSFEALAPVRGYKPPRTRRAKQPPANAPPGSPSAPPPASTPSQGSGSGSGNSGNSGTSLADDRLLSVLLMEMDGIASAGAPLGLGRDDSLSHAAPLIAGLEDVLYLAAAPSGTSSDASGVPTGSATLAGAAVGGAATGRPLPAETAAALAAFGANGSMSKAVTTPTVIVIAITRDIGLLDGAVTRPGRLDVHVHTRVLTEDERRHALRTFLRRSPIAVPGAQGEEPQGESTAWTRLLDWLSGDAVSDGWSVAECEGCAHACASRALRRHMIAVQDAGGQVSDIAGLTVTEEDIRASVAEFCGNRASVLG